MNFSEAYSKELDRGRSVIYVAIDEECNICHKIDELRMGICFGCKDFAETNMIEVWDKRNPAKKWPYNWISKPLEVTEHQVIEVQKLAEDLPKKGE